MIIYKITNLVNGKVYIGQTVQTLEQRKNKHISRANNEPDYRQAICKAIKKYGVESFLFEEVEKVNTLESLNEREIYWIDFYNSKAPNGYNLTDGGGGTIGYRHAKRTKKVMREKKSGVYDGEKNPFFGKKHSKEQIEKWKKDRSGRKLTDEWKRNISQTRKRKKIINLDTGEVFESARHVARYYGKDPDSGTPGAIAKVCQKKPKFKTVLGFRFEYYDPQIHDNTVPSLKFVEEGVTTIRME